MTQKKVIDLDLVRAVKAGDARAAAQLIRKYEPLAHKFARKYGWMAPNHSYDDLVQEGRIGVYRAALAFEPERGFQFLTLAFNYVRGAVQSRARKENRHPRFTTSYEDLKSRGELKDPTQEKEIRMDLPEGRIRDLIVEICGDVDSKRAQILCHKFGLLGKEELKTSEISERYGLTKQAVQSYVTKFRTRVRKLYPELEAYV